MEILAYIFSILGQIMIISASLIKGRRMKLILLLVFGANFSYATSYVLNGTGINGAASCYLGSILAVVNYFFDAKNKKLPRWLLFVYAALFVAVNVIFGNDVILTLLAIVATMCFVMGIAQTSGKKYRFWTCCNLVFWITFDIISHSYSTLLAHSCQMAGTILGMILHDRKEIHA